MVITAFNLFYNDSESYDWDGCSGCATLSVAISTGAVAAIAARMLNKWCMVSWKRCMVTELEMPFGLWTWVGARKHCRPIRWGPDPPWEGAILREEGAAHCKV